MLLWGQNCVKRRFSTFKKSSVYVEYILFPVTVDGDVTDNKTAPICDVTDHKTARRCK